MKRACRYSETIASLDRALTINPDDADSKIARAMAELDRNADIRPLSRTVDSIRAESPGNVHTIADSWFVCAMAERNFAAAADALAALGEGYFGDDAVLLTRAFGEGLLGRMMKDDAKARAAFTAARAEQEKVVEAQPGYGPALCVLGMIDAALGRSSDALSEGRRAVDLLPVAQDSVNGAHMIEFFAVPCPWAGEKNMACEQLANATQIPGDISYGQLRLKPYWDGLRGDPHFEQIVASLAPKDPH